MLKLLAFIFSFPGIAYADCDSLRNAQLYMGMQPGVYAVNAGEVARLPVTLRVGNPKSYEGMDRVELVVMGELGREGAARMQKTVVLWEKGKLALFPAVIEFPTTLAMQGDYRLNIFYRGSSGNGCGYFAGDIPDVRFRVANAAENVDIDGPVIKDVHLNESYVEGEPFSFELSLADGGDLCLEGWKECEIQAEIWINTFDGFLVKKAKVERTGQPDRFRLTTEYGFWWSGEFSLHHVWLHDRWGNRSSELRPELRKEFIVR